MFRRPSYERLLALYENYDADVTQREDNTRQEQTEEADYFLTEIIRYQEIRKHQTGADRGGRLPHRDTQVPVDSVMRVDNTRLEQTEEADFLTEILRYQETVS